MSVEPMTRVFKWSKSSGVTRLVLLALADTANDDGYATAYARSQAWLARKANCTTVSVSRALKTLEAMGEIEILRVGKGRKQSDYRITISEPPQIESPQDVGSDPKTTGGQTPQQEGDRPPADDGSIIPSLLRPVPAVTPSAPTFADFYAAFPRKKEPKAAEAAWLRAIKDADPATIVAAAERYAAEMVGASHVKYPATWLNKGCWMDEPTPPADMRSERQKRRDAFWAEQTAPSPTTIETTATEQKGIA